MRSAYHQIEYSILSSLTGCQKVRPPLSISSSDPPTDPSIIALSTVYFNFKQHQISPSTYLPEWVVPMFLNHLPFEMTARIWDAIILEGDSFIFRVAIAVLGILESRLFFPERKELMEGSCRVLRCWK